MHRRQADTSQSGGNRSEAQVASRRLPEGRAQRGKSPQSKEATPPGVNEKPVRRPVRENPRVWRTRTRIDDEASFSGPGRVWSVNSV